MKIKLYTKENCDYSNMCKRFLQEREVEYQEVVLKSEKELINTIGKTLPQVIIDDISVGGYFDLIRIYNLKLITPQ